MSTATVTLGRDKDTKNTVRYGEVIDSTDYAVSLSVYVAKGAAKNDTVTVTVNY